MLQVYNAQPNLTIIAFPTPVGMNRESEVYSYAKRNFVNQITAKKILRLLVEEGNYKTHAMDDGNRLKLYYFLKDVEIK